MAPSIKYRVRLTSSLAPTDPPQWLTPAMLAQVGLDPDGLETTTLSLLRGLDGTAEEQAVWHSYDAAAHAASRYYGAQTNHALERSVEEDWEATAYATQALADMGQAALQADYDRAQADAVAIGDRLAQVRQDKRYLATQEGGRWDIVAERGGQGGWRVVATHYPSGEIREPDGSSGSVAQALLTLGNTIASDWGQPYAEQLVEREELEDLVANYEAAMRNLRGCEQAIQEARGQLDEVGVDVSMVQEYVQDAIRQADQLSGQVGELEDMLASADSELDDLERQGSYAGSLEDTLSTAGSEADEAAGYLGRVEDQISTLKARLVD